MNNQNTNINIRIDSTTKEEAELLFKDLGMNMSTAINLFLKQSIRNKGLPFTVTKNVPNNETIKAIKEAEEISKHPKEYKTYSLNEFENLLIAEDE
jgi:addiction module antitoxin, RelB/DinJ family